MSLFKKFLKYRHVVMREFLSWSLVTLGPNNFWSEEILYKNFIPIDLPYLAKFKYVGEFNWKYWYQKLFGPKVTRDQLKNSLITTCRYLRNFLNSAMSLWGSIYGITFFSLAVFFFKCAIKRSKSFTTSKIFKKFPLFYQKLAFIVWGT